MFRTIYRTLSRKFPGGFAAGAGGLRISYLLRDMFSTALAAGSVDGTAAEPGPGGNRAVTDGNNVLSIAGGVLNFVTGGVGAGDPGVWYSSLVRQPGRTFMGEIIGSNVNDNIGLHTLQFGAAGNAVNFTTSTVLRVIHSGTPVVVGVVVLDTLYEVVVIMRSAGLFFFIKGGSFTNWTLLFISTSGSGALFPFVAVQGGTTSVFSADNLRVPDRLFIPTPLASDSFNRADGVLGNTDGAGHAEANGGGGLAWTDQVGTWAVLTNAAAASALSGGIALATVSTTSPDVVIDVEATRSAGNVGGIARYEDSDDYLEFHHDGTNAVCVQMVAGTPTTLRTAAATYSAGAVLRLILEGTTGRLFYNNAAVGASFTVPASTFSAHGVYTTNTGNSLDDFTVWARGTGNEYQGLDIL